MNREWKMKKKSQGEIVFTKINLKLSEYKAVAGDLFKGKKTRTGNHKNTRVRMLHSEDRKLSEKTGEAINFIRHWKNRDHG